jgi:hypothetical protein
MKRIRVTRALFASFLFLLLVLSGMLLAHAQESDCTLTVMPRVENGHAYYEIIGAGFPAHQQVTVEAINGRAQEHRTFLVTPINAGISGIFIGKTADRDYYQVARGKWKVNARADRCRAKTKFTVPDRVSDGVRVGVWGGNDIGMRITDTAVAINFFCAVGAFNQPLVPNDQGNFDVSGTYAVVKLGWPPSSVLDVRYTGRIEGSTMTLAVNLVERNVSLGTYTLIFGKEPPPLPACR